LFCQSSSLLITSNKNCIDFSPLVNFIPPPDALNTLPNVLAFNAGFGVYDSYALTLFKYAIIT